MFKLLFSRYLRSIFTVAFLSFLFVTPSFSGPITVTNTNDSGSGSLRQAIRDVGDGEEITFSDTCTGTITLTSDQLDINKNITISGPGEDILTISGGWSGGDATDGFRVFQVGTTDSNPVVTISGLTISDGSHGEEAAGGGDIQPFR